MSAAPHPVPRGETGACPSAVLSKREKALFQRGSKLLGCAGCGERVSAFRDGSSLPGSLTDSRPTRGLALALMSSSPESAEVSVRVALVVGNGGHRP